LINIVLKLIGAARDLGLLSKFIKDNGGKNMEIYSIPEIARNVFWVGVKDWNRRMFVVLIPLPQGTSYNA